MAAKTILSTNQQTILNAVAKDKDVSRIFYLTGGTALAEFYLHHRYSEDLDFFSEKEVDPQLIFIFLKKIIKNKKIATAQSFNRNLFFIHFNRDVVKMEFTYYPFPRIEKGRRVGEIRIDSLIDIAVNKLFTTYQKPAARHFIDVYYIIQKEKWSIASLIKKAKIKFDWHIDPLQLGRQFIQAKKVKDYPRMIKKIDHSEWQDFFVKEAKKLEKDILE